MKSIKLTEETVKKNPRWIEASKSIYKWNEGNNAVDLKTDQDYAEYGLNYMGRFNYNLPQMTVEANQLKDATDKQKKDFITLMDMYDKKSASWAGAGRLFKGLATDPTTYIGATTLGVGTAGAQAVKQAIKEGVKQGTKAGLKQGAKIGSLEGAVYSTADNYGRQSARINAGVQEDFDLGESAKAATIGAVAGAGLGGVVGGIGSNRAARSKLNQIVQREDSTLQKENVDAEQIQKETQPIIQKEITREAEQTIKPSTQQEAPLAQKLQEIVEPIPDTNVSAEEIASGLLGKNYQKIATQTIDFLKTPFIKYRPLKTLPDQEKYLTLRGLATGKLQKVRDVTRDVYDTFAKLRAKGLARAMANTKQVKAAELYNQGFATAQGDGVSLFNTAHPTVGDGNQSNTSTAAAIAEGTLESAVIAIQKFKDDRGILIGSSAVSIHVPVDLMFTTDVLLNTPGIVGSADNDLNSVKNLGVFPSGYFTNRRFTDANAWFIKTDVPNGSKMFNRTPLQTKMEPDFDTGNLRFKARERYSFGVSDWRSWFGNQGA